MTTPISFSIPTSPNPNEAIVMHLRTAGQDLFNSLKKSIDSDKAEGWVYVPSRYDRISLDQILPVGTFSKDDDNTIRLRLTEPQVQGLLLFCMDHNLHGLITPATAWPIQVSDDSGPEDPVYF